MDLSVIERCSGHGGAWGCKGEHFDIALKVGKPVARQVASSGKKYVVSECPLASTHIEQGVERVAEPGAPQPERLAHPIELLARAYGVAE